MLICFTVNNCNGPRKQQEHTHLEEVVCVDIAVIKATNNEEAWKMFV